MWRNWEAGTLLEIVDPCIVDLSSSPSSFQTQVVKFFKIGLLCVQVDAEDRPTMPSVVVMLGSEAAIPQPKPFTCSVPCIRKISFDDTGSSSMINDVSYTVIEPR